MKRSTLSFPIAILVFVTFSCASCALHFADNGGGLPSDDKTIYVERFLNVTRVSGINDQFMRYLVDEIDSRGRLTVVDSPAQADLLLTGKILYGGTTAEAFNGVFEPLTYSNSIMVSATLTDTHTNKVLWRTDGVSGSAVAPVVAQAIIPSDPQFLQQNLRGPDILRMTDMQVAATQNAYASAQMMRGVAAEIYDDMVFGL
ncbi:hypothetical protein IMX07_08405 [bacterium]|jgi:hypothetical protein|nr:hypothetical protein [bacterium]